MSATGVTSPADLVKRPPLPEQVQAGATTGPGAPGRTQSWMPPTSREQSRGANRKGLTPIAWPLPFTVLPWLPTTAIYIRHGRAAEPH